MDPKVGGMHQILVGPYSILAGFGHIKNKQEVEMFRRLHTPEKNKYIWIRFHRVTGWPPILDVPAFAHAVNKENFKYPNSFGIFHLGNNFEAYILRCLSDRGTALLWLVAAIPQAFESLPTWSAASHVQMKGSWVRYPDRVSDSSPHISLRTNESPPLLKPL